MRPLPPAHQRLACFGRRRGRIFAALLDLDSRVSVVVPPGRLDLDLLLGSRLLRAADHTVPSPASIAAASVVVINFRMIFASI